MYTYCWDYEVMGCKSSSSVQFMIKVMLWYFVSDTHKVWLHSFMIYLYLLGLNKHSIPSQYHCGFSLQNRRQFFCLKNSSNPKKLVCAKLQVHCHDAGWPMKRGCFACSQINWDWIQQGFQKALKSWTCFFLYKVSLGCCQGQWAQSKYPTCATLWVLWT